MEMVEMILAAERRGREQLEQLLDVCPNHRVLAQILRCKRCARVVWDHFERIAKLPTIGRHLKNSIPEER